jgi:lysophospholipase L1-like esterase
MRVALYQAATVALALALTEGICRLAEPRFEWLLGPFEIEVDPELLGFEPHHEIGHLDLVTYANEGGYNGSHYPRPRRDHTLRIAVLGDSFTFGWGVPAKEAWPALLEERLDVGLAPLGLDAEVLNFGVPGYNTWLQLLHWREVVSGYSPDVVLLGYYSNDAVIDRRVPNVYRVCPLPTPPLPALFAAGQERSAGFRVAHDLFWIAREGSPLPPWEGKDVLVDDHFGFRCSIEWAARLAQEVTSTDASFAVVQLPHMADLDDADDPERGGQERLRLALEARGVRTDDLYPRLAGQSADALNNADNHPNEAGNRAILEAMWPGTGRWILAHERAEPAGLAPAGAP